MASSSTIRHMLNPQCVLPKDDDERTLHERILTLYDLIEQRTMANLLLKKENDDLELQIKTIREIKERYQAMKIRPRDEIFFDRVHQGDNLQQEIAQETQKQTEAIEEKNIEWADEQSASYHLQQFKPKNHCKVQKQSYHNEQQTVQDRDVLLVSYPQNFESRKDRVQCENFKLNSSEVQKPYYQWQKTRLNDSQGTTRAFIWKQTRNVKKGVDGDRNSSFNGVGTDIEDRSLYSKNKIGSFNVGNLSNWKRQNLRSKETPNQSQNLLICGLKSNGSFSCSSINKSSKRTTFLSPRSRRLVGVSAIEDFWRKS